MGRGQTGTGKSALLSHMARQIMNGGKGLIVMETEGNLLDSVLGYVPRERVDDVVVLDLSDRLVPADFDPLDQGDPHAAIDDLIGLFEHLYGRESIWAPEYIDHGLQTLLRSAATASLAWCRC